MKGAFKMWSPVTHLPFLDIFRRPTAAGFGYSLYYALVLLLEKNETNIHSNAVYKHDQHLARELAFFITEATVFKGKSEYPFNRMSPFIDGSL